MRRLMEKYDNAFGYVSSYFFLTGMLGIVAIVIGIVNLFVEPSAALPIIIAGVVLAAIGVLIYIVALNKCSPENRKPVGIFFSMILCGFAAAFVAAWWFIKFCINLATGGR